MISQGMPKRPRQHQLEAESRAAIQSAIPSEWVYRTLDQDYGVDSEIEIFDENGYATGIKFLVQLKATDESDIKKALSIRFSMAKYYYYKSLEQPVLIVRYHSPSKQLYVRWFHGFDLYYSTRTESSFTFRLTEKDLWQNAKTSDYIEEVVAFREIRNPIIRRPLQFIVIIDGAEIHGLPSYKLLLNLKDEFKKFPHILEIKTEEPTSEHIPHKIFINNELIRVTISGFDCFNLHLKNGSLKYPEDGEMSYDIMIGVGLALHWHDHSNEASIIISRYIFESRLAKQDEIAFQIGLCLARANQINLALEVAEQFYKDKQTMDAAQAFLIPILESQRNQPDSVRDYGVRVLKRISSELEKSGDESTASVISYNCGNLLRSLSRHPEAVAQYNRAAKLVEEYTKRAYYWREIAGSVFLWGHYDYAARFYKKSLDIEDHKLTKALYADALMFSGQYKEANIIFDEYLQPPIKPEDSEWELKRIGLGWIQEKTGKSEQRRTKPNLPESIDPKSMNDDELKDLCYKELARDALSGFAWFNLGCIDLRAGDLESAIKCYLVAALVVPVDLEAWGNVIYLSIKTKNELLAGLTLSAAFQLNGNRLLDYMAEKIPDKKEEFVKLLSGTLEPLTRDKPDLTLRAHRIEGGWDEIVFKQGKVETTTKR